MKDRNRKTLSVGLALLAIAGSVGCAVRHLANGQTAPATKFEQIMAWNTALAQANDGLADNVIGLQAGAVISKEYAQKILAAEGKIAQADKRVTANLKAAAVCGLANAGTGATPAAVSDASAACAKSATIQLQNDLNLILSSATDTLGAVDAKDPKVAVLAQTITNLQTLANQVLSGLRGYAVVQ